MNGVTLNRHATTPPVMSSLKGDMWFEDLCIQADYILPGVGFHPSEYDRSLYKRTQGHRTVYIKFPDRNRMDNIRITLRWLDEDGPGRTFNMTRDLHDKLVHNRWDNDALFFWAAVVLESRQAS